MADPIDRGEQPKTDTGAARHRAAIEAPITLTASEWQLISDVLRLSNREGQIVRLTVEGLGEHDIAAALGIARRTVHAHCERMYRKLDVHSRSELILRLFGAFVRSRLVMPP